MPPPESESLSLLFTAPLSRRLAQDSGLSLPLASSGCGSRSALRRLMKSIALPEQPAAPERTKESFRHAACNSALWWRGRLPVAAHQVGSGGRQLRAHRRLPKSLCNVYASRRLCPRQPADRRRARLAPPATTESDVGSATGSVALWWWPRGSSPRPLPIGRDSPASAIYLGQAETNTRQEQTARSTHLAHRSTLHRPDSSQKTITEIS